jgi:hypothetical protein
LATPSWTTTAAQRRGMLTRLGSGLHCRFEPPPNGYRISRLRADARCIEPVADHYAPVTSAPAGTPCCGPAARQSAAWIAQGCMRLADTVVLKAREAHSGLVESSIPAVTKWPTAPTP